MGALTTRGQIVILNGAPRSGKSSIVAAIQETFDGVWMNLGVDVFVRHVTPERYRPGIGLRPGEAQVGAVSADNAGFFVEQGFYPIQILKPDPLFAELPDSFVVRESHTCEIKQVPAEFELIATNENCRVQAMKHRSRPLWGTQFHPEAWQDEYPQGRQVLVNFFRLAGIIH